jgi:hypothetical protein
MVKVIERTTMYSIAMRVCNNFADKDLYIKLPCKVGDEVYFIKHFFNYAKQPLCGMVCMIRTFSRDGDWAFGVIMDNENRERKFTSSDIGKTVFLTREDAEKKLEELKNE